MRLRGAGRRPRRRGDRCAHLSAAGWPRDPPRRHRAGLFRKTRRRISGSHLGIGRRSCAATRSRWPERTTPPTDTAVSLLSCFSITPTRWCRACLLAQGDALVSATVTDKDCAAVLAAAEAAARQAKRGIWADPSAIKNAESPDDILAGIGRFMVVEGKVLSVRQAGATTYLNFGRNWTRDFAVTISRRMMAAFEAAGIAPKSLENRQDSGPWLGRGARRPANRGAPGGAD